MGETSTTRSEIVSEDMIASSSAETQKRNALPRPVTLPFSPSFSCSRERERANKELRTRATADRSRVSFERRGRKRRKRRRKRRRRRLAKHFSFPFPLDSKVFVWGRRGNWVETIFLREDHPDLGRGKGWVEGKESRRFIGLSRAVEGIILPDVARSWEVFRRIFARDRL